MVFERVTEAPKKMLVSLEGKSRVEARFTVAVATEYIFACFVSRDPNFCWTRWRRAFRQQVRTPRTPSGSLCAIEPTPW
ncbi:hypothetical protein E2562_018131 [Oryza meyeriana var. granulata]|uniref:Uncharacterized protein n=1 Tax=Oryza meyeriana var. granulata TaxID=110450 RepID=A0A6G1C7M9_9ORYZ|nr:hypothetical protein E2562_018131 [Oryza meyeriana var. granulata]